jgi:Flp pilus assembly protein TadD
VAIAAIVLGLGVVLMWFAVRPTGSAVERGVAAFEAGRLEEAERWFRESADEGSQDPAVWLYLGRIHRRSGRWEAAAAALRTAVDLDPADADVRRELGYLFLDLSRPASAVEQFRRAQELAPDEPLGWIGLIRSLRAAGSAEADAWLSRAPAEVRSALRAGRDTVDR